MLTKWRCPHCGKKGECYVLKKPDKEPISWICDDCWEKKYGYNKVDKKEKSDRK